MLSFLAFLLIIITIALNMFHLVKPKAVYYHVINVIHAFFYSFSLLFSLSLPFFIFPLSYFFYLYLYSLQPNISITDMLHHVSFLLFSTFSASVPLIHLTSFNSANLLLCCCTPPPIPKKLLYTKSAFLERC